MNDKIIFVDVGGLGGLKPEWQPFREMLTPIVFEPNSGHADALRPEIEGALKGRVVEAALGSAEGHHILNITKAAGCSSLLLPNRKTLSEFSVECAFEITGRQIIQCVRYDELAKRESLPPPDIIKIDVQGYEHEVLLGFGDMLADCVAIELEAHLYPLYEGQKLLHDYVALLKPFGLTLRKLTPSDHFDGFAVEYDAWFTAGPGRVDTLSPKKLRALEIAERAWDLPQRRKVFDAATFAG